MPDAARDGASPLILAVDTALAACSAALVRGDRVIAARHEIIGRGHAERLMPMTEEVMTEARAHGLVYADVDAVAVTVGPGAFTGLRIGLAAARALALALGCPVVPVTTFAAVAAESLSARPLAPGDVFAVLHDARRGELYVETLRFSGLDAGGLAAFSVVGSPCALPLAAVMGALGEDVVAALGSGVPLLGDALCARAIAPRTDILYPDARWVARLAARRLAAGGPLEPARPLYLRAPDAKLPGGILPS